MSERFASTGKSGSTATPGTPGRRVQLRLHGSAQAAGPGGEVLALKGRAAVLVAMAALEPGGIGRDRAAVMLWPDAPQPRQNLRQQLLRFRQSPVGPLLSGDASLRLADDVQLLPAPPGALLLAGEAFDDDEAGQWLERRRQQERAAHIGALRAALAEAEAIPDAEAAASAARDLLRLDPDDESHHMALMRAHYLRGDATAGLRAFRALQGQLGAAGPAAMALARALQDQADDRPASPAEWANPSAAMPVTLWRPPRLAGRMAELQAVAQAWNAGHAVLLLGEAGMGKTRLIAACLEGVAGPQCSHGLPDSTAVLAGSARPGDSGTPYATLARLLAPALGLAGDALPPVAREVLRRVLQPAVATGAGSGAALRTGELQAAVSALLQAAAPAVVALDDLHFADPATIDLVAAVIAMQADEPAGPGQGRRWILAQRPAEAPPSAQALRDSLIELRLLEVVALAPLDTPATQALLASIGLPGLDSARLAEALARHCGGNPLFLLETLKQGLADGSLRRGDMPRPAGVGALIEHRLQRLSEPALNLAQVAAIAGVDFCIELAEAVLQRPAMQLATAWNELQQAQVLRDEAFAHDLVADAVLRVVPKVVWRRVHAQCAQWLQDRQGDPARVARHWVEGGQPAQAAARFEQAAQRAQAAARQAEEAELYAQAALAHAAAGQAALRFEALAARVNALIGAQADAASVAEARALAGHATSDAQRARAARVLADLLGQRGPFEEAVAVGRDGLAIAVRAGVPDEQVRLASLVAGNLCKLGRAGEAHDLMLPLRPWVEAQGDDQLRHIWFGYWGATLGHIGRLREAVAAYDSAIAAAARRGDRPGQAMALMNQCVVLRTMGALDRACDAVGRGMALSPIENDNANHQLARLMQARNQAETGQFGLALAALEDLVPRFEAMAAPFWVWAARGTLARLWQHLGQHARALQALRAPPEQGLPDWMVAGLVWVGLEVAQWREQPVAPAGVQRALALVDGDVHRRAGNQVRGLRFDMPAQVLEQAGTLAEQARRSEQFGVLAALHLHEARAALALDLPARATQAARALVALLDEGYAPEFVYGPEAWQAAGEAFERGGDPEAAQRAWASGVTWVQARALPQVPPPFIESFLQRNPVNRALLARAGQAAGYTPSRLKR